MRTVVQERTNWNTAVASAAACCGCSNAVHSPAAHCCCSCWLHCFSPHPAAACSSNTTQAVSMRHQQAVASGRHCMCIERRSLCDPLQNYSAVTAALAKPQRHDAVCLKVWFNHYQGQGLGSNLPAQQVRLQASALVQPRQ